MFDVRGDFPVFDAHPGLAFLDSAASSQTPRQVIEAMADFDATSFANVHRGAYRLSQAATMAYEGARASVAAFVGAADASEVVFTRGTTSGLNLVAAGVSAAMDDRSSIVVTGMEHHANLVPWQQTAKRTGAELRTAALTADHRLDLDHLASLVDATTAVLAVTGMSNVLGVRPDLDAVARIGRATGATIVVDGAQLVPHTPVDLGSLDVDALAFGAHKMLGPTGIGALWLRPSLAAAMEPFETGGEMILDVTDTDATWAPPPAKFEAGTMPITQAVGFGAAVDYLAALGMEAVADHEARLTEVAIGRLLGEVPGLEIQGPGPAPDRGGVISFTLDGVHAHDVATILDEHGVAVRAGHHCAKPLMRRLGTPASARASFSVYSTEADLDPLVEGLLAARRIFG